MDIQHYDLNRNTEPFNYTSSIVFIGHAFFMLIKEPSSKLSALTLARQTLIVSDISANISSPCNAMDASPIMPCNCLNVYHQRIPTNGFSVSRMLPILKHLFLQHNTAYFTIHIPNKQAIFQNNSQSCTLNSTIKKFGLRYLHFAISSFLPMGKNQ